MNEIYVPSDRDALTATLVELAQRGARFCCTGGETELGLGNLGVPVDAVVRTTGLQRVLEYAPEDQTITVEAGMTFAALDEILASNRQMLPLDVGVRERATIGGAIAMNAFGARRHRYGSLKDMLLGIEIVRPDGIRARGGGRVVKNVAGFDLPKLMVGGLGTLGAILSVTLRVYPLPAASAGIVVRGVRRERDMLDPLARAFLQERLEPTVLAVQHNDGDERTTVLFSGDPHAVEAQCERALALALTCAEEAHMATPVDCAEFWAAETAVRCGGAWRTRTLVPPTAVERARTFPFVWNGAHRASIYPTLGIFFASGSDDERSTSDVAATIATTRRELGGELIFHAMPERWRAAVDAWGPPPADFPIMQALKTAFDPATRCNPGRFVGGL
jgi:glycolate oxidase FAD binding subunit